ncbi:MAG: Uma2 family endonuclease [Chloroflexota bacterium]
MTDKIRTSVTLADLQQLDAEDKWVEVDDGILIEGDHNVTFLHILIMQTLFRVLDPFVRANKLGSVFMDGARYILAGTPTDIERARKPDFSFLRTGRIPADFDWSGDFVGAPDLAVEIVSPGQTNPILLPKIFRYLEAGSDEAWLIYPDRKTLYQYRRNADEPKIYSGDDVIDTSGLFPGLRLGVADLFVTELP